MNWTIESYVSDTGTYFVSQRGVKDWTVLDPTGTVYDGFTDENSAMSFAESLNYANTLPPPSPLVPTPMEIAPVARKIEEINPPVVTPMVLPPPVIEV
jgi:hypothetical protein